MSPDTFVGDTHGEFGLLSDAFSSIDFNRTREGCFGLGDLIDRGGGFTGAPIQLRESQYCSTLGCHEAHHFLYAIKYLPRYSRVLVIRIPRAAKSRFGSGMNLVSPLSGGRI